MPAPSPERAPSSRAPSSRALSSRALSSPTARSLQRLSRFMDTSIRLPGGYRIGWDGIIGLVPGVGDLVGLGVSAWIVLGAARLGVPRPVLARMAGNVALEALVGAVPLFGDLFDMAFKANMRNMRLLERHVIEPDRVARHSSRWLLGAIAVAVLAVLLVGWIVVSIFVAIVGLIF